MTLKQKLILSFTAVIAIAVAAGIYVYLEVQKLYEVSLEVTESTEISQRASALNDQYFHTRLHILEYVNSGTQEAFEEYGQDRDEFLELADEFYQSVAKEVEQYDARPGITATGLETADKILQSAQIIADSWDNTLLPQIQRSYQRLQATPSDQEILQVRQEMLSALQESESSLDNLHLEELVQEFLDSQDQLVQDLVKEEDKFVHGLSVTILIAIAMVIFWSTIVSILLVRGFDHKIKTFLRTVRSIAGGNITERIEVVSHDEFGTFAESFNAMAEQMEQNQKILSDKAKELDEANKTLEERAKESDKLNDSLQKAQKAILNILEDLKIEKEEVEDRVTERTRELEAEKEKLSNVTQNMQTGAILLDAEREVVFANQGAYDMLGLENGSSKLLETFFSLSSDIDLREPLKKCKDASEPYFIPELDHGDKIYGIIYKCLSGVRVKKGEMSLQHLILINDITERKLFERSKSELIAVASHQLRTPLTAIRGNLEMLLDNSFGGLNKEQNEMMQDIEISTIRLITMVNDMLDITKIEKNSLDLEFEEFDLEDVIVPLLTELRDYADKHEVTFDYHPSPDRNPRVYADKKRAHQIFQNLMDNAVKYSRPPGVLAISYEFTEDAVTVILKDNGIGIPKNEQPKMFGRFYRASNTSALASSGSGLGLYIVKSVVEIMHGTIRFESEEGVGTTFFVTLPVKKTEET